MVGFFRDHAHALKQIIRYVSLQEGEDERTVLYLHSVNAAYYDRLRERHPKLTVGQVQLCGLLRSGMSNTDITTLLHITVDSLKKQRYRLRKALELKRSQRLEGYLMEI